MLLLPSLPPLLSRVLSCPVQFGGHGQARSVPASGVLEPNEIYDTNDLYDSSKPLFFDDLWVRNSMFKREGRTRMCPSLCSLWAQCVCRCIT
jgi:hypothetical protein